ncbi:hypothetical protein XELAEV_18045544mg [Xenopus laevis]|uniref:Uncharacterized protein n=1 Tax=Xenopus laevis TaxID=8355 RepID=A0A974H4D9_XENLA|nr:hypothetical protein XELAEV_18045544mg [Xenopus laevis]
MLNMFVWRPAKPKYHYPRRLNPECTSPWQWVRSVGQGKLVIASIDFFLHWVPIVLCRTAPTRHKNFEKHIQSLDGAQGHGVCWCHRCNRHLICVAIYNLLLPSM